MIRTQTRMERYQSKKAKHLPIEVAIVNFGKEVNFLSAVRSAACFGAQKVHLIGNCSLPRNVQRAISGTTIDLVEIVSHSSPSDFLSYCRSEGLKIAALELPEDCGLKAERLDEYEFSRHQKTVILSGAETSGVPFEILNSRITDIIYIEMLGAYCLNTATALTIALYEASNQLQNV